MRHTLTILLLSVCRLGWNLSNPVALDFVRFLLQKGCLFEDDWHLFECDALSMQELHQKNVSIDHCARPFCVSGHVAQLARGFTVFMTLVLRACPQLRSLKNLCILMADSALRCQELQRWRPSILAAGIILSARRLVGVRFVARPEFHQVTGTRREHFASLLQPLVL